jgi:hypothetical protein
VGNNAHLVSPIDATEQLYRQYCPSAVNAPSIWTVFPRPLHDDDDDEAGAAESHQHPERLLISHDRHAITTTQPSHDGKTTSPSVPVPPVPVLELLENNADSAKTGGRTDVSVNLRHQYCLRGLIAKGSQQRFSTASGHPHAPQAQDSHRTLSLAVPDAFSTRVITQIENIKHHNNHNTNNITSTMTATKQHLMPQSITSSQQDQGGPDDDWFVGHAAPRSRSRAIAIKRTASNKSNKLDHHHGEVATDDDEETGTDQMYDYATWRMYHRIIDHRQKHPVPEDYHRPAASSSSVMESSSSAEESARLQHQPNDHSLPLTKLRPKPGRVAILSDLDDVIFDMDF